ncbi:MAG: gfo/Idh/MocA family oxidoreductase [Calditrichaeota bacterium]|nr:MAG: gfo/Idh/MocA family oxidoreductase [Calditrichota bacterium]
MTQTLEEADILNQLAREKGLKIQIGHIERFNPAILAIEGLPINPLFIEAHRMSNFNPRGTDVAVILDLMIHDIDLILSFVKSPITHVDASGVAIISSSEDIANCRLQFENGCVANVTASRISTRKMRKMRFFQPNAYISVDFLEGISEVYYLSGEDIQLNTNTLSISLGALPQGGKGKEIRYARLEKGDVNPLRYELQQFCRAVINDTPPPVTGEDGRRALAVAEKILDSINQHTEIVKKHWKLNNI